MVTPVLDANRVRSLVKTKASSSVILAGATTILSFAALAPVPAQARGQTIVVDFTSVAVTRSQPSLTFTNGAISLTAEPTIKPGYVHATSRGLCILAHSTDGMNRCDALNSSHTLSDRDTVGISANARVFTQVFPSLNSRILA